MFKKAYVRGICKALIDCQAVKFANEDQAIGAADQVAERLPEQPMGDVPPEATAELAANLVDLSNALQQSAGSAAQAAAAVTGEGGGGAPAAAPPAPPAPPEASAPEKAASLKKAAALLRSKFAIDTGSTIVGDRPDQENRPANTPSAEAKLDEKNRPGGDSYANVGEDGVGKQQDSGKGAIGSEKKREGTGMGPAEGGSNSATEAVKGASAQPSLRQMIQAAVTGQKTAESVPGTTIAPGKPAVDARTGEGAMELNRRPENYAVKGEDRPGESDQAAAARAAQIGKQSPHPGQEPHEGGTNTAIKQSAEDEEYIRGIRMLGQKYASRFPFFMDNNEKVAALQYLSGLPPSEREMVVSHIEKTAELPEGLKKYLEGKKGHEGSETPAEEKKEEEKKDGKKDEKKDGEKTASARPKPNESAILARLRNLNPGA